MDKKEIGERIRFLRERKGISQNALANAAGVSPTYIYQLERGEKCPTVEYLEHICWGLDVPLTQFFLTFNDDFPSQSYVLNENEKLVLRRFHDLSLAKQKLLIKFLEE